MRSLRSTRVIAAALGLALAACARPAPRPTAPGTAPADPRAASRGEPRPLVIAHRGASGHRPEHTLEAYALAVAQGADYIEPDVVRTRDGALVVRHEPEIGATTDVAARFPERRATRVVEGDTVTGWFVDDFTLAELRTLRAVERLPGRSHAYDGQFLVPTLDEVLELADRLGGERRRPVGVYPETKHPDYFRARGLPLEESLAAALVARDLATPGAPVFVQSFSWRSLERMRALVPHVRRVLLVAPGIGVPDAPAGLRAPGALLTPDGLAQVATLAQAIGVEKSGVLPLAAGDTTVAVPTTLVADAHRAGLLVHVWTLRSDDAFLSPAYRGDAGAEWRRFAALEVDGIFGDFPDVGIRALRPGQVTTLRAPRGAERDPCAGPCVEVRNEAAVALDLWIDWGADVAADRPFQYLGRLPGQRAALVPVPRAGGTIRSRPAHDDAPGAVPVGMLPPRLGGSQRVPGTMACRQERVAKDAPRGYRVFTCT